MFRTFPTFGAFIFWLLWPWFVVNFTARAYRAMSGKHIPKDRLRTLRKSLASNAKAIMNPVSPDEGEKMANFKPSNTTVKNTSYAAAGAVVGTIITIAVANAAFRVPKHLKVYLPKAEKV